MAKTKTATKPAAKKPAVKKPAAKKTTPKKAAPKKTAPTKAKTPAKAPSFDLKVTTKGVAKTLRFATQEQLDEAAMLVKRRMFDFDVRMRGSRRGLPSITFSTLDGDVRCILIRLVE